MYGLWACSQGLPRMTGNKGELIISKRNSSWWRLAMVADKGVVSCVMGPDLMADPSARCTKGS